MKHPYIAKRFWTEGEALSMDKDQVSRYKDLIDLSIGDMDVPTDGRIIDAACRDAKAGHTTYGLPEGDPELTEEICRYYQKEYGMSITPEQVYVTASSLFGLELALFATLDPGDEVLVLSPYFVQYKGQIEIAGGRPVEVPLHAGDGYAIRREALERAVTPRTRGIIFNNPCNPTGVYYGRETLELLADFAVRHDLLVYADDIYTLYVFNGRFTPIRGLPGMAERTLTFNSFSKNYLMTGWRVGYVAAEPHFTHTLKQINNNIVYSAPSVSQRAAIEALRITDSIKSTYIEDYKRRVFYAAERINAIPYLSVRPPQGTFYLFPDVTKTGLTSVAFQNQLFERAHVLVTPGSAFGETGEGHVRIVCTASMANLKEAFDRMERLTF